MPQVRWFDSGSLAVVDWHCPGGALGTGAEECAATWEVSIGRAGSHAIRSHDGERVIERTQLWCVNAGEVFRPVRRVLGLDRRTRILLTADAMRDLVGESGAPRFAAATTPLTAQAALAHDALLRHAADRDPLAVHTLALALAGHAVGAGAPRAARPTPIVRDAVRAVQELLARRYAEPLTLAALAAHAELSPWHLSRSFRAHVGLGLHQYRTRLRLLAALDQLRDARRPELTRIAFDVGFSSHSHLTRAFHGFFRVPPSRVARGPENWSGATWAPESRSLRCRGLANEDH